MSIINTQAVADARKARTGKDGALYNSNGKLLASIETYQSQMAVANQKYHPLGTPKEFEVFDSYGLLNMQSTGEIPEWNFQGVLKGSNGSEQRYIYNNCVPSGNIDIQNIAVGSIVKRQWSLFVNGDVKPQGTLRA